MLFEIWQERIKMLPLLVPMLTNVIGGLVADAATDLAKEHVEDMVEKVIPPEAMEMVDKLVEAKDPSQPCSGMVDLITRMADPDDDLDVSCCTSMPSTDQMLGWSESLGKFNDGYGRNSRNCYDVSGSGHEHVNIK